MPRGRPGGDGEHIEPPYDRAVVCRQRRDVADGGDLDKRRSVAWVDLKLEARTTDALLTTDQ